MIFIRAWSRGLTKGGQAVKRWANIISTLSLGAAMLILVAGCGKKVTSSSGDTSSERIKPEAIATVPPAPDQRPSASGGSTAPGGMEAARSTPGGQGQIGSPGGGSELQDIYFDYDRFTVRADGVKPMEQNARWLRGHKGQNVLIEGHCDERGTQAYNLVLGEKRARSAKRYLEDLGILGSQLQITSYGENRPVCSEQTESCYQRNRRAHFVAK
jgi:peptidoglycan-associated lipoprotein